MLELKVDKKDLLVALQSANAVADRKGKLPVLANVLLKSEGGNVVCAATDLRTTTISTVGAIVVSEGGITVAAKTLFEIVKNLPTSQLHLKTLKNERVEMVSGSAKYSVVGLPELNFPNLPSDVDVQYHNADAQMFVDMINKTSFSMASDDSRPHLNGMFFRCFGGTIVMVSTDGHRLSKAEHETDLELTGNDGVVIPRKGILEAKRALENAEEFQVGILKDHMHFSVDNMVLAIKLLDVKYPPYEQVIPDNSLTVKIDRQALHDVVKRMTILANSKTNAMKMILSENRLSIKSENPDLGESNEEMIVNYSGDDLPIGFNSQYLTDILGAMDDDDIEMKLGGPLDPGIIQPAGKKNYMGVVMPLRL